MKNIMTLFKFILSAFNLSNLLIIKRIYKDMKQILEEPIKYKLLAPIWSILYELRLILSY